MEEVTVYCLAYNHENYIKDALDGFVNQKTSFPFIAIVHDDASTDDTARIIKEYAEKYPDIIKPIFQSENQWSKKIGIVKTFILPRIRSKYVCMCEGDDYWVDEYKLQKQYDYMESHPECTFCFTNGTVINLKDQTERAFIPFHSEDASMYDPNKTDYTLHDSYKLRFVPTASFFFKYKDYASLYASSIRTCRNGDLRIRLFLTGLGYAHFINENTCVYRSNVPNSAMTSWKEENLEKSKEGAKRTLNMLFDLDSFTDFEYHEGLLQYMRQFGYTLFGLSSLSEIFSNSLYREIFNSYRIPQKMKIIFKSLTPRFLYDMIRERNIRRQYGRQKKYHK